MRFLAEIPKPRASLATGLVLLLGSSASSGQRPLPRVVAVPLRGMVHAASAELVIDAIRDASARGAALVVLEIDTPGGYMSSMEEIQNAVLASRPPVAALVEPAGASAASAGFFIVMTADVAAMAPGTSMGSAHPILVGPGDDDREGKGESVLEKKIAQHAAARMRTVAERRGRNVEEAEKAVRESVSFTDQEALSKGLIEHIVADTAALVRVLDGRSLRRFDGHEEKLDLGGAVVERVEMTLRQRVLSAIATPQIAYLLFLLGVVGIYVELTHPGFIAPGVVGAVSLLLALYATTVLSVNVAGLLLILLAVVLLVLEVKVTSYGVLGAGGVVALVLGSLMLFEGPMPGVELTLWDVLPASGVVALILVVLATLVVRARQTPHVTGKEGLVGLTGTTLEEVGPSGGRVFVLGESWSALAREPIAAGSRVRVVEVRDLTLQVERDAAAAPVRGSG